MNAIARLQKRLTKPLLVSKKENLLYLTGRSFIDGYLLVTKRSAVFFGNGLEQAGKIQSANLAAIGKYVNGTSLAVEDSLKLEEMAYFKKKLKGVRLTPISGVVEDLRAVKTGQELAEMKRAYEITAWVFDIIKRQLKKKQWTEVGLARYIRIWGLELGADDISFDPIVAVGTNAAIPHHAPTAAVLKPKQSIVLDFGFKVNGYCSDFTRTVFLGSAPAKMAQVYNHTETAYQRALAAASSGKTGREVDAAARDYLHQVRLEKYFIHSLGHGTGLEVHEQPGVGPYSSNVLQNGMVFSIEPGVYLSRIGGVRIEDLVYLQNGQPNYFVSVPTDLKSNIIN